MLRKTLKECPECASRNIFRNVERGETTCRDCGLVIEDRMVDFSQESLHGDRVNFVNLANDRRGAVGWTLVRSRWLTLPALCCRPCRGGAEYL